MKHKKKRKISTKIAWQTVGIEYSWGGDLPGEGLDCSGFCIYVSLTPHEIVPYNYDNTVEGLYHKFIKHQVDNPYEGCWVIYNTIKGELEHMGYCIDEKYSIQATQGAVQVRLINRRDMQIECFIDPFKKL